MHGLMCTSQCTQTRSHLETLAEETPVLALALKLKMMSRQLFTRASVVRLPPLLPLRHALARTTRSRGSLRCGSFFCGEPLSGGGLVGRKS